MSPETLTARDHQTDRLCAAVPVDTHQQHAADAGESRSVAAVTVFVTLAVITVAGEVVLTTFGVTVDDLSHTAGLVGC